MVGDKFKHVMRMVIQHSDFEYQEKYLTIIHEAVKNNELGETPLKMLIDRVHKKKYDTQIFGSQSGGDLADDETIRKVKKAYNID